MFVHAVGKQNSFLKTSLVRHELRYGVETHCLLQNDVTYTGCRMPEWVTGRSHSSNSGSDGPTQTTALVARSTSSSAAVATEHSNETWQVSFPSGWKDIDYWYGPNISSQLSADKRRGLSATTFEAEQTKIIYYVDFGSLTQRNVTSGRIRKIRCIPSW